MRSVLALLLLLSLARGEMICIEGIENPTDEPYLSYSLLKVVERAVLESGNGLSCSGEFAELRIKVKRFEEIPLSYTPQQRVSSYNLVLSVEVFLQGSNFTLSGSVPYSLPSGGLGDLPRRKALDDLLDKIYLELLKNLRRWSHAHKRGDGEER